MLRKGLAVAVILLFIGVAFAPTINAVDEPVPDLDCYDDIAWRDIKPGETVQAEFDVENIGEPNSELNWEIDEYPDWGTWTFTPDSGTGLTPEDGAVTIDVEVVVPEEPETEFTGEIVLINSEEPNDFCIIWIGLAINKQKSIDDATPTPIVLVLQLITKLRNHKDIQNVETEDDVLLIIENGEELNSIYEQLSGNDCGCEEESSVLEWKFPAICLILFVIFAVALNSSPFPVGPLVLISYGIAEKLNCPFTTVR